MTPDSRSHLAIAIALSVGVALSGFFIGRGFVQSRTADRFVTVKGVAEREVKADLALWPIRFVAASNSLGEAQAEIARSTRQILALLGRHGIDTETMEVLGLEVQDAYANPYREGPVTNRFIVTQTIMVRSTEPDSIMAASQRVGDLLEAGVLLSSGYGPGGPAGTPTFLFTRLNDYKPDMIAEATAAARQAAAQFAADSRSSLGGIRRANQGIFVILPRDQASGVTEESQLFKTIRVVATIDYYLD
ncbi:MAG: SIMPL domain-containing protein [Gemmatimonadota bacterium]|nr:SIMPL domain-containing protein [Gemmatimonadota bacterium]MDH4350762.1 SIMPL domain-containing protein [Gemmatimonadota bacterium]MDH5197055.1 SIMPL domain-containing protein [Gemmatimonadota bacterium]